MATGIIGAIAKQVLAAGISSLKILSGGTLDVAGTLDLTNATLTAPGVLQSLDVNTTPVTVTSTTSETDLMTYTIPAGQLASVGDRLIIEGSFAVSGAGNMDGHSIDFGSTTVAILAGTSGTNGDYFFRLVVVKTGTDTQSLHLSHTGGHTGADIDTTATEDDGSTISVAVRTDPAATTKSITQSFMSVDYVPAAA